ncbi:MAG: hypothetical protein Q8S19_01025 [Bacillota bacterium]|nr:hypothetical protein [Bacillota bacterium]
MRYKRSLALVVLLSFCLQLLLPAGAGATPTQVSSHYNNYVSPLANYNVDQLGPYNTFFANRKESIHPGTGNLTITETDLVLPGRNGLDIVLTRVYQQQQANAYRMATAVEYVTQSMWVPPQTVQVWEVVGWQQIVIPIYVQPSSYLHCYDVHHPGYWTMGWYIDEWDYLAYGPIWVPGYTERVCEWVHVPGYWVYLTDDVPVYGWVGHTIPGYWVYWDEPYVVNELASDTFLDARNGLGLGWQWDFPSLEIRGGEITLHSGGQSMLVDWNSASRFKDYPLQDMRFDNAINTFSNGQVSSRYKVTSKDGRVTYFSDNGRLLGIVDRYHNPPNTTNAITFQYHNGSPVITKIIDTVGREVAFSYTSNKVTVTAPGGRVLQYNLTDAVAGKKQLSSMVDPLNRETKYTYSLASANFNFLSKSTSGPTNVYANLTKVEYPTGAFSEYTYGTAWDNLGSSGLRRVYKIASRYDKIGQATMNLVTYSYDGQPGGYPTHHNPASLPANYIYAGTMTKADGTTVKVTYNNKHLNTITETTGLGVKQVVETTYHVTQKTPTQVVTKTYTPGTANFVSSTTQTTFDVYNNLTSSIDAFGTATSYSYDANKHHQPTSVVVKDSQNIELARVEYVLDVKGNRTKETRKGIGVQDIVTNYTYDIHGNMLSSQLVMADGSSRWTYNEYHPTHKHYLTKVTVPYVDAQDTPRNEITQMAYNHNTGLKTSVTDPLGATTSYLYDALGRLTRETNPENTFKTYAYDDVSRTITVQLENGTRGQSAFDALGRLTEQRVWRNNAWHTVSTTAYDNQSRKLSKTNALSQATTYSYDGVGRVTEVVYPGSTPQNRIRDLILYDDYNRTVTTTDANNNSTKRISDVLGRLVQVKQKPDAEGSAEYVTTYTYDRLGNLLTVTDARGKTITRQYDGLNRLATLTYPGTTRNTVTYTYNNAGQVLTETNGSQTSFTYDARGLLTRVTYADTTYNSYTYDLGRRLTHDLASASAVASTYIYDNRNRLTDLTRTIDLVDYTLGFAYDNAGNITAITYPGDTSVDQVYDELNRLMTINGYATLSYDAAGNLSQMAYNNGITTSYSYNNRGLLSQIESVRTNPQTTILNLVYA